MSADSSYWQEKAVKVGDRDVLVERVLWKGAGAWKLEAWIRAPLGTGTYFRNGKWLVHPVEDVAKRAIATAYPEARGDWDGRVLTEAKGDPAG